MSNEPETSILSSIGVATAATPGPTVTITAPASSGTLTGAADTGPIGNPKPEKKPSVRRMVSFFENVRGTVEDRAAMICHVHDDGRVNLVVWDHDGTQRSELLVEQGKHAGGWHWPEFVG